VGTAVAEKLLSACCKQPAYTLGVLIRELFAVQ